MSRPLPDDKPQKIGSKAQLSTNSASEGISDVMPNSGTPISDIIIGGIQGIVKAGKSVVQNQSSAKNN